MNLSTERKWIIAGFSLAILLTGFSQYASYLNTTQLQKSVNTMEEVYKTLNKITILSITIVQAESQQRNYLSDGHSEELIQYKNTIQALNNKIHQLQLKVANNSNQYQRLEELESLIIQWQSNIEQVEHVYQENPLIKQIPDKLRQQNQQIRTKIEKLIGATQVSEEKQMRLWILQDESDLTLRFEIELISGLLSFLILFSLFALDHRQMVKRQQAENHQRILAQEKELGELKLRFFSMASHEFRTPLSLILGSAQLLIEDTQNWSLEKKRTNLERIQSAARVMNQLLTDMLTLTRAEVGKLEFAPTLLDVESFCLNLIEDFQTLSEPNHQIEFISSKYCAPAYLDEKLLYSIFSNLLSNAIKYSPQGDTIQIRLNCLPQEVVLQIQDQGIGIPIEAQNSLYEPFYRASNVGVLIGTGLGLTVVKKCIELHQGEITIESEVGVGTKVTVRFPQNRTRT